MPGYANWKDLYTLEYLQLYEEGYPVGDSNEPDLFRVVSCQKLYEKPLTRPP